MNLHKTPADKYIKAPIKAAIEENLQPSFVVTNIAGGKKVEIVNTVEGDHIYYTTDGTTPTSASTEYTNAITQNTVSDMTYKAIAIRDGMPSSSVVTQEVVVTEVDKPSATVENIAGGKKVTITAAEGVTIHYTTDGETPTAESDVYESPIELIEQGTTTIKAIGIKDGSVNSEVKEESVAVSKLNAPTITNTDGVVSMSAAQGTSIYYTTDGEDPTTESELYESPVTMTESCTVKAYAVKSGSIDSNVASEEIVIV